MPSTDPSWAPVRPAGRPSVGRVSSRPARHRRTDQASLAGERLLARLGAIPEAAGTEPDAPGWVPERPPGPVPGATGGVRWAPSRRALAGLALVVVGAVLVAVVIVWQARPTAQAAPRVHRVPTASVAVSGTALDGPSAARTSPSPAEVTEVVVHVVGAVRRPGLVRLPGGARVADAVRAAGGATAAARPASVNLARVLVDGEQLVVQRRGGPPVVGAAAAAAPATTPGGAGPAVPVDLNTATVEALDSLPGIGPVLAQRVLEWRAAHGSFATVEELGEVSGIGEATLSDLRPLVTV